MTAPLDRTRWPSIGDEVLYRRGDGSGWTAATVLEIASHDGDLMLDTGDGTALAALDVKHGSQRHQWLHYGESPAPHLSADRRRPLCDDHVESSREGS